MLTLQSRPAQISEEYRESTEPAGSCKKDAAALLFGPHSRKRLGAMQRIGLLLGVMLLALACDRTDPEETTRVPTPPMNMEELKRDLGHARGESKEGAGWPRRIEYTHETYDFRSDTFQTEKRVFALPQKPTRIVPHSVGVAEILWAICPRERLIAFNDLSADPEFCVLAEEIQKEARIFNTKQTELIIAYEPDLVFTVFYSGEEFKEKLKQAQIPCFELGHFGTIGSIRSQIRLIGRIIGEEGNAEELVRRIDTKMRELRSRIPEGRSAIRVLYYDEGGYVPGRSSNFQSICDIIRAVNVGAEQGIKSWSQIDYETLLKWDPDIVLVPEGSGLEQRLDSNPMLEHARAVKTGKVFSVPGIWLRVASQFIILSANYLAGVVYEGGF